MDAGIHLRTGRERLGLTLADIADRTKISPRVLRAIEDGDTAALPPPIFVRGFLRSYAREVGLDPDDTVRSYVEQAGAQAPARPTVMRDAALTDDEFVIGSSGNIALLGERPSPAGALGALALAAIALAIVGYLGLNGGATEAIPPGPGEATAVATTGAAPEPTAAAATTGRSSSVITLAIHPTGLCWVEVRVNGEMRVYRLMQPGDRETVHASGDVLLRVGDPTAFAYTINGRPGRPLGITSQPVSIRISPDTLPSLLG
jgi:hypothetical protein